MDKSVTKGTFDFTGTDTTLTNLPDATLNQLNDKQGQWVDMGLFSASKKRRHLIAPKSVLRWLMDRGHVVVRTVNYSVWTPEFSKANRGSVLGYLKRTRRVEAMITADGIAELDRMQDFINMFKGGAPIKPLEITSDSFSEDWLSDEDSIYDT